MSCIDCHYKHCGHEPAKRSDRQHDQSNRNLQQLETPWVSAGGKILTGLGHILDFGCKTFGEHANGKFPLACRFLSSI
jgi:hypothetical protein